MLSGQPFQPRPQPLSYPPRIPDYVVLKNVSHIRYCHSSAQRVPAERRPVVSGLEHRRILLCHHRPDGEPSTKGLGQRDHVRLYPEVLVGEKVTRSPDASLHLVENEQQVPFVAPVPHLLQVFSGWYVYPALALDRLQHHCTRALAGRRDNSLDVIEGHGRERGLMVWLTRGRHHSECTPVERLHRRNHFVGPVKVYLPVLPCDFYRRLVCLGPAVLEEHLGKAGIFNQQLC